jgi:hypothetical protein
MRRVDENTSYGANSIRDGVGLIPKEELEPIVLAEDVHNFSALEGMIRVANARATHPFPIAKIKLRYIERPVVADGFKRSDADPVRQYLSRAQLKGDRPSSGVAGTKPTPKPPAAPKSPPAPAAGTSPPPATTEAVAHPLDREGQVASGADPRLRPTAGAVRLTSLFEVQAPTRAVGPADVGGDTATSAPAASEREPMLSAEDVAAVSDDDTYDPGKALAARPEDLTNEQEAHRARRRQEQTDDEWSRRQALLRAEPDTGRVRLSVLQREGDILAVREPAEDLGSIERATVADIHYAQEHQHEALAQAGGLLVAGLFGANMGEEDRPPPIAEAVQGELAFSSERVADSRSIADAAPEDGDASEGIEDLAVGLPPAAPAPQQHQNHGHHWRDEHGLEEAEPEPDRDREIGE